MLLRKNKTGLVELGLPVKEQRFVGRSKKECFLGMWQGSSLKLFFPGVSNHGNNRGGLAAPERCKNSKVKRSSRTVIDDFQRQHSISRIF